MATHEELIAANYTIPEICEKIGADSLCLVPIALLFSSEMRSR